MKKKIKIFIIIIIILVGYIKADQKIKKLKIINQFPTYDQMVGGNFSIYGGRDFDIHGDYLYMSDHFGHMIFKFDLEGNFVKHFGRQGQGPGEFHYPNEIQVYKGLLYVCDNRNSRIQILDLEGSFVRQIKLLTGFMETEIINDKFFIHDIINYGQDKKILELYDLKGNSLKKIKNSNLKSRYNKQDVRLDASLDMVRYKDQLHCLQQYGTTYLIYDSDGNLVRHFQLEMNPLDNKQYKKIEFMWSYPCFGVYDDKIFAAVCWRGKIMLWVFDMEGRFLYQMEKDMEEENEIYIPKVIKHIIKNGKNYLYISITYPDTSILVAEIN